MKFFCTLFSLVLSVQMLGFGFECDEEKKIPKPLDVGEETRLFEASWECRVEFDETLDHQKFIRRVIANMQKIKVDGIVEAVEPTEDDGKRGFLVRYQSKKNEVKLKNPITGGTIKSFGFVQPTLLIEMRADENSS